MPEEPETASCKKCLGPAELNYVFGFDDAPYWQCTHCSFHETQCICETETMTIAKNRLLYL